MGFCHEAHGPVALETRRESFKIHYSTPWDEASQHMELSYDDFENLERALGAVRVQLEQAGKLPSETEVARRQLQEMSGEGPGSVCSTCGRATPNCCRTCGKSPPGPRCPTKCDEYH